MRAPIIGAAIDDLGLLRHLVRASTRITHTDPKAEYGAFAVALASRMSRQNETVAGSDYLHQLTVFLGAEGDELVSIIGDDVASVEDGQSPAAFAGSIGLAKGVSGYVYHSVPVSIHAWLSNQRDFRSAVTRAVECGGDADSTGAIVGGIVGASVGKAGILGEWIDGLREWPRSAKWMERLGAQVEYALRSDAPVRPVGLPVHGILLHNLFFLAVVLFHGFRRLLPPY